VDAYIARCEIHQAGIRRILRQQRRKAMAATAPASMWRRLATRTLPAGMLTLMRRRLYGDA
jgi:hypothetical protein